jgi:hypothetical protein
MSSQEVRTGADQAICRLLRQRRNPVGLNREWAPLNRLLPRGFGKQPGFAGESVRLLIAAS